MVGCRVIALGGLLLALSGAQAAALTRVLHGHFGRAGRHMVIDGRLDEAEWAAVTPITQFFEIYPANAGVPTVRTEARFLYDELNIYVGIRAYDPNPQAIRSSLVRRDQVMADQDFVELLIDPLNGHHSALLFRSNPQGVATDGLFDEDTQLPDYTVDLDFDVSARIDQQGWTVEFRIPLSSLRYRSGGKRAWTIGVLRNLPRSKTVTIASAPMARKANCVLCYLDEIGDIDLPNSRDSLSLTPYVTFFRTQADGGGAISNVGHEGFDAKWQPQPNLAADLTVAPDFSQVEADDLQLTANTRFALSVTEKRPFFLEGADLLSTASTGINAIYTRSFTEPDAGARVTRRGDDYEYSALLVRDSGGGSVIEPGPVSSRLGTQDFASTAFVGRLKLHEGGMTWGALATVRLDDDGSRNAVYGGDATWTPGASDRVFAQILGAQTRNPDRPDLLAAWTGQRLDGTAWSLAWTHSDSTWYSDLYLQSYSAGFRAWNGYVPQVGVSYATADAGINFYPHAARLVRISPLLLAYHIEAASGGELGKYAAPGILFEGPGNTALSIYWYPRLEDMSLKGLRTYSYVYFALLSAPTVWMPQMKITAAVGEGLDAVTGQIGTGVTVQALVPFRVLHSFELRPTLEYQSLESRGSSGARQPLFTEIDAQADVLWYVSRRFYVEALYQKSRLLTTPQNTPATPQTRSTNTLLSLLLSYQANWQTRCFVGFRRGRNQMEGTVPGLGNRSEVFAKLTYAFSR